MVNSRKISASITMQADMMTHSDYEGLSWHIRNTVFPTCKKATENFSAGD